MTPEEIEAERKRLSAKRMELLNRIHELDQAISEARAQLGHGVPLEGNGGDIDHQWTIFNDLENEREKLLDEVEPITAELLRFTKEHPEDLHRE